MLFLPGSEALLCSEMNFSCPSEQANLAFQLPHWDHRPWDSVKCLGNSNQLDPYIMPSFW